MRVNPKFFALAVVAGVVACVPPNQSGGPGTSPGQVQRPRFTPVATTAWPIRTAEYVDLWLHGWAMVTGDTAHVPLFSRDYRQKMLDIKRERHVSTALDSNAAFLAHGFNDSPTMADAQFVILQFSSWDQLMHITQQFVANDGYPRFADDPRSDHLVTLLQASFHTVTEREWLDRFVHALDGERTGFYHNYWLEQQRAMVGARLALDSMWTNTYRERFRLFLGYSGLGDGSFVPSLPLGGEGRTVTDTRFGNAVTTAFPDPADPATALYVFTHEVVDRIAAEAIAQNLTAAERRNGSEAPLAAEGPSADVRGGAILLQRIAPELVPGYERFYIRQTGMAVPSTDLTTAFEAAFPSSERIIQGMTKDISAILDGGVRRTSPEPYRWSPRTPSPRAR